MLTPEIVPVFARHLRRAGPRRMRERRVPLRPAMASDSVYASPSPRRRIPSSRRTTLRGEARLRELNERLGWDVQDEDVDTIAGYIMKRLGRTARVGDVIDTPYGRIRVENMAQVRITQVAILPASTPASEVTTD